MMGRTVTAVGKSDPRADHSDGQPHAADTDLHLLIAAHGHEGGNAIDKRPLATEGEATGDRDQVLLGDASVDILTLELFPKPCQHEGALIIGEQYDTAIAQGNLVQSIEERVTDVVPARRRH